MTSSDHEKRAQSDAQVEIRILSDPIPCISTRVIASLCNVWHGNGRIVLEHENLSTIRLYVVAGITTDASG